LELGKDESRDNQEEKGLSTFQKDEEQTTVKVSVVPFPVVGNPYPDQTPSRIGERWFQVDVVDVTKSATASSAIQLVLTLLSETAIQDALQTFRYIRWKSISVRTQNSTIPQVFGVGHSSSFVPTLWTSTIEAQELSWDDAVLFDYSVQNDVTTVIPWRTPDQWLDWYRVGLDASADFHDMYLYTLRLGVVNVLSSDAAPSLRFVTYAKFDGLEAAGHVDDFDSFYPQAGKYMPSLGGLGNLIFDTPMSMTSRGANPNDVHRQEIEEHMNGSERPGPPQKSGEASSEPSDPEVRNNPFGSLISSPSLYTAGSGTLSQRIREFTVRDIISRPTFILATSLVSGFGSEDLVTVGSGTGLYWSRINYMAQFFRMWRGSIRYTIIIFSSPFISARYNVIVKWGGGPPIGTLGNEIITDVTVRGTTRVDVTVPFLSADQWLPTWPQYPSGYTPAFNMPGVAIQEVSPAVGTGDIVPSPILYLYESAGDDFQFRSLCNPNPNWANVPPKEERFVPQMRVSELSRQDVTGDGTSLKYPYETDTEMSISSMCQRWCNHAASQPSACPVYPQGSTKEGLLNQISSLFVYWSGQIKFKILCKSTNKMACYHTDSYAPLTNTSAAVLCARPEDGMANVWTDLTRVIDATAPFLATTSFLPVVRIDTPIDVNAWRSIKFSRRIAWFGELHNELNTSETAERIYMAGGPDFSFYFNVPPPLIAMWPLTTIVSSAKNVKPQKVPVKKRRSGVPRPKDKSCSLSDAV